VNVSNEQPPVRKVIPYKSGKRPSTFRRLNIDFAGTALEEALNEQERQSGDEMSDPDSLSTNPQLGGSHHQSPPVTTTPHLAKSPGTEKLQFDEIPNENVAIVSTSQPTHEIPQEESPPVTTTPQRTRQVNKNAIAPARDFNRRANSLDRDAMPSGLFPGSTKKVYDALYFRTRGAIVPTKSVRASRRDLLTWTGIRNLKTIDNHIRYLMATGLIVRDWELGSNEGSCYEVRLPEEIGTQSPPLPTSGGDSSPLTTTRFLGSGYTQKLGSGGEGQTIDYNDTSANRKTSFKTDDDTHTLAGLTATLIEAARCVVGGEFINSEQERERWNELGKLLADELIEAAQRTEAISSVPAFFTGHLRRRLARKPVPPAEIKRPSESSQKTHQGAASNPEQNNPKETGKASERETQAIGKSKFSLEECRRYADHLHTTGQGITNPGGFALTIYRSGISDAFIEKFLHPNDEAPIDASACQTCQGTGFYYPHGAEQGVAKCKHEGLKKTGARPHLKPEEIIEQADIIGELLGSGYTMEQAEAQFAMNLNGEDWTMIRARLEGKKAL
jgi:hypothetical protein